ncbi:PREDICTED: uncharacterized protein LOC105968149 [Erythranthe guttata]|uniref:uncharacterized protein LOC105968149 n=1 Tax=Erythranthe guttata TaxID=4155 RepID=UPI00064DD565|nr:PREDICTED: uncharacterized protein LOC105968149 [Erythranthe guttata]|eukprot:XP_012848227.1 PREDICTED: uncharacterized protein LOC105968149 [Erythranthe guttata]
MFCTIFRSIEGASRWRKASKCKILIKEVKIRLAYEKRRKCAIVRQSCTDIAQLLHDGHRELALSRVEKLHKDRCKVSAYDQFDGFCDCILDNLHHIARPKLRYCGFFYCCSKLPIEVSEAVSCLIFGASRCGELPELHSLRNLFKQHFGPKFERTNVELLSGHSVDSRLIDNLNTASLPQNVNRMQLLQEIQKDYIIHPNIKKQNEKPHDHDQRAMYDGVINLENEDQIHASKFEEMVKKMGRTLSAFANYGQAQEFYRDKKVISNSLSSHVHPRR